MTEPLPGPTGWVIWPKPGPVTRRLRWRRWAGLRAAVGGYFWAPCPLCGQMFGGQECGSLGVQKLGTYPIVSHMVCPAHDPVWPPPAVGDLVEYPS